MAAAASPAAFSYGDGVSDDDFEPRRRSVTPRNKHVVQSVLVPVSPVRLAPIQPEERPTEPVETVQTVKRAYDKLLEEHRSMDAYFTHQMQTQSAQLVEQRYQLKTLEQRFRLLERKFRAVQDACDDASELLYLAQRALKRRRQ